MPIPKTSFYIIEVFVESLVCSTFLPTMIEVQADTTPNVPRRIDEVIVRAPQREFFAITRLADHVMTLQFVYFRGPSSLGPLQKLSPAL